MRSDDPRDLLAVVEKQKSGNAADTKPLRKAWRRVAVDFHQLEAAGPVLGDLLNYRRHDPAWAAPGSPEIDQHRQRALLDHRRIVGLAGFRQPGQRRPAGTAMRHAARCRPDSILPPAIPAADERRGRGHGHQPGTLTARRSSKGVAGTRP